MTRALVQQHDRAGREVALDPRDHARPAPSAPHRSRAPTTPPAPGRAASARAATKGLAMPTTARNQRGGAPARSVSAAWASSICAPHRRGGSAQNQACGWVWLCWPMPWPRRAISRDQLRSRLRAVADQEEGRLARRGHRAGRASPGCRRTGRRRWSARPRGSVGRQARQHRAEQARLRPQRRPDQGQVR